MSDEWEKCPYCGSEVWIIYHAEDNSIMRCKNCGKIFDGNQVREMKNKKSIAELEAECAQLRKVLMEIAKFANGEYEKRIPAPSCVEFLTIKLYAEKALKGAGE
ncbi:hypothetical protein [Victivallis vadensis]|uniref:hypothetical protein n=1 Tax=Victivallis vadensis TaxID=172901 RepID=UPI0023F718BA|nr:hypothetical protein [Victivallis vadensis]